MTIIYSHKPLRDREPSDFYPTPIELCRAGLLECMKITPRSALDVGAGDGVWGQALREINPLVRLSGIDIREDAKGKDCGFYDEWILDDFMFYNRKFDLIFGNIPFRHANEFIKHSLDLLTDNGHILYLLRSAISESKKRFDMFFNNGYKPLYEYQSVRRISFTGNKKSDNTAYSIFVWEKRQDFHRETMKRWLDWDYDTPTE